MKFSGHPTISAPVLILVLLLIFTSGSSAQAADLQDDRTALLAFRAGFDGFRVHWNTSSSPCSWFGVTCNSGRVTALRLPGSSIIGQIPPGTIGNLTALRSLSLRFNDLSGPLPPDISCAIHLSNLDLQGNHLSGEIPPTLSDLSNLVILNLAFNGFSGGIPTGFNNLTRLTILFLEKNNLSGQLPDIDLPRLSQFNISYNQFIGTIPTSLRKWPTSAFLGMPLCGGSLIVCPGEILPKPAGGGSSRHKSRKLSSGAIAGICLGSFFAVIGAAAALLIVFCLRMRKNVKSEVSPPGNLPLFLEGTTPQDLVFFEDGDPLFDLGDLGMANYQVLGMGASGPTMFRVTVDSWKVFTFKKLYNINFQETEFRERTEAITAVTHDNILPLRGYCFKNLTNRSATAILIYDYIPNGSLAQALHGDSRSNSLDWSTRYQIALAAAKGINYIHTMYPGIHGKISSSNILLGEPYYARVSEHGLFLLRENSLTDVRIPGYGAPESMISQKADVFSFGMLLLELLTGRDPLSSKENPEGEYLDLMIWRVQDSNWISMVVDPSLRVNQNEENQIVDLLKIAKKCVSPSHVHRPTMSDVLSSIEKIQTNGKDIPSTSRR